MNINIPTSILGLKGQRVNDISCNQSSNILTITCRRDKRYKPLDSVHKEAGAINLYVRRTIHDLPLFGHRVQIEIELIQVLTKENKRRMEHCDFVDKGCYYTKRFCCLISGLCRYMTTSAVALHFNLRWETVKNMDKKHLQNTLPALHPERIWLFRFLCCSL